MKRNAIISLGLLVFVALLQVVHAQTYTYDLGGRLTGAAYTNGTQVTYSYDAAGNISAVATNSVTQTTNSPVATISTPAVANNGTNAAPYTFSFTWGCVPGLNYEVLFSPDLNSTNWTILAGPMAATNCTITTSDLISTNSQRFYRVILLP
jgi:YD repeat-containing protein